MIRKSQLANIKDPASSPANQLYSLDFLIAFGRTASIQPHRLTATEPRLRRHHRHLGEVSAKAAGVSREQRPAVHRRVGTDEEIR